jgi:hypothetical protein
VAIEAKQKGKPLPEPEPEPTNAKVVNIMVLYGAAWHKKRSQKQ